MSREPQMSDAHYAEMLEFMATAGFDPDAFRKVPHDYAEPAAEISKL